MNAPQPLHPPDDLVGEALGRLARVSQSAGHPEWIPPLAPVCGDQLNKAIRSAGLERGEALVVALLAAVESDPSVSRMVAAIQDPVGGARVLAGLAATLFAADGITVTGLLGSRAVRNGLVTQGDEPAPLPERSLAMPSWLAAAISGVTVLPPGVSECPSSEVVLPRRTVDQAAVQADVLSGNRGSGAPVLVIRAHCRAEGEAMARGVAEALGRQTCALTDWSAPGLAIWLAIMNRLPVVQRSAGPGETVDLTPLDAIDSPLIVVTGMDGQIASARRYREWRAAMPDEPERAELWTAWGLDSNAAKATAARYRQSAGRIAELGRGLTFDGAPASVDDVVAVMKSNGGRIDALARRTDADVRREDIILPPALDAALARLVDRLLLRNRLHHELGSTIAARYKPGVRALFTGDSGTGKTLAVQWLASEAGLPLYRVDLSALTSKWIGETEKNLSQLLDAAEQGDVMLFFDEADSLFGARTDVGDAHDRYANSQTNFLLQRIEDYEGVAILATNSRDRFDPAFVRRLDMVLEFPLPDAPARRRLWDCHLGDEHSISAKRLDRLAAAVDLTGGHVRNVVLAAAARARSQARPIGSADLDAAIAEEYAKLGRSAPALPHG